MVGLCNTAVHAFSGMHTARVALHARSSRSLACCGERHLCMHVHVHRNVHTPPASPETYCDCVHVCGTGMCSRVVSMGCKNHMC